MKSNPEADSSFVLVCDENNQEDTLELPLESNGTLAQSTLHAQFPGATGLKYKKEGSDRYRGVRVADGFIYPPEDGSWANIVFVATFPKGGKRKADDSDAHANDSSISKEPKVERQTSDLIVLSLPYKAGEPELRQYFSQFGQLASCDIKRDKDGHSRGFGFVRFSEYSVQERVLGMRHYIDGRWCDVKVPNSQIVHESNQQPSNCSSRVFVGRLPQNVTEEQIRTFFNKFGAVTDIYLPRPFRSCAFVTFRDISIAQSLVGKEFPMEGNTIHIACANPRMKDGAGGHGSMGNQRGQGGSYNQQGGGGYNAGGYAGRGGGRGGHHDMNNGTGSGGSHSQSDMMNYFGGFNSGGYSSGGNSGRSGPYNGNRQSAGTNLAPPMPPGGPGNMMNSAAFIAALSSVINQSGWQNPNAGQQYPGGPGGAQSSTGGYGGSSGGGAGGVYGDYNSASGGYGGPGSFSGNSAMYR